MSERSEGTVPLFTVIVPVYNPPFRLFKKCVKSVRSQSLTDWEMWIVDDSSPNRRISRYLWRIARKDRRIRVRTHSVNLGIAPSTRTGIDSSQGRYIVFLDHDDQLQPGALDSIKSVLENHKETDFIYSDEEISLGRRRTTTIYKPDYSPVRLLSQNYIGHVVAVERDLLERCGGIRDGFEGAQDYDLCLRATSLARRVEHVRDVLYRWNIHDGSFSQSSSTSSDVQEAGLRALQSHLAGANVIGLGSTHSTIKGCFDIEARDSSAGSIGFISTDLSVSPHQAGVGVVTNENRSAAENLRELDRQIRNSRVDLLIIRNRAGLSGSLSDHESLLVYLLLTNVGISAPLVIDDSDRLISSGHFHRRGSVLRAGFGMDVNDQVKLGPLAIARDVSSVGWEVFGLNREHYTKVGGFSSEVDPELALIDLSLKMRRVGISTVVVPKSRLLIHESCGEAVVGEEKGLFSRRWRDELHYDPFDWVPQQ